MNKEAVREAYESNPEKKKEAARKQRIVVLTFHMQVSLSSNGHEITKETSKYKKLLISKRVNRDPENLDSYFDC